jgi:hypothetical protein
MPGRIEGAKGAAAGTVEVVKRQDLVRRHYHIPSASDDLVTLPHPGNLAPTIARESVMWPLLRRSPKGFGPAKSADTY